MMIQRHIANWTYPESVGTPYRDKDPTDPIAMAIGSNTKVLMKISTLNTNISRWDIQGVFKKAALTDR
jgi:hypothetical protein